MIVFNYKYTLMFQDKKNMYTKLLPRTLYAMYQFHIKIYLELFVSVYHLRIFYNLNITLNYWFFSKKPINIKGKFI